MSLIISTGTNLNNRLENLLNAKVELGKLLTLSFESNIYESEAVDYLDQPNFLNQVLEFELPQQLNPNELIENILAIESNMGRIRNIPKGPRIIDIDILFWGCDSINLKNLTVPHPRLFDRKFIVDPLRELPYFPTLEKKFKFKSEFSHSAQIYRSASE